MGIKKYEKMSEYVGDAHDPRFSTLESKMSVMAAALQLLAKGSRYEEDVKDIIEGCYPDYFKNKHYDN